MSDKESPYSPADNVPAIEARDVVRTFQIGKNRIEVLKQVSLQVERGEKLFLCGPSGAGKTTLLYTLAGLERPNSLDSRTAHLPTELSGGEQQRVAIARSLINDPSIIFADEPTGNLDTKSGGEVMNLLMTLAGEKERTLLVVTHDMELAETGDRKVMIVDGKIEE